MPYQEISERNMSNFQSMWEYVGDVVPVFYPLLLFVIFIITTIGSFENERKNTGRGKFLSSLVAGSFVTTIVAILLQIMGLINILTLITCIILTSVFTLILFLSK